MLEAGRKCMFIAFYAYFHMECSIFVPSKSQSLWCIVQAHAQGSQLSEYSSTTRHDHHRHHQQTDKAEYDMHIHTPCNDSHTKTKHTSKCHRVYEYTLQVCAFCNVCVCCSCTVGIVVVVVVAVVFKFRLHWFVCVVMMYMRCRPHRLTGYSYKDT